MKNLYKKENYSSENKKYVHCWLLFLPYFFRIELWCQIIQIIHIQDKTLDPYVSGGFEWRCKVQTLGSLEPHKKGRLQHPKWTPSCIHVGLWPMAIKLNPLWKTEVSKSAWIKPCCHKTWHICVEIVCNGSSRIRFTEKSTL